MDYSSPFPKPNSTLKALAVFGDDEIKEEVNHCDYKNAFAFDSHEFALGGYDRVSYSQEVKESNNC